MGHNDSGITKANCPWSDAPVSPHDAGSGDQGIGGGLDQGAGGNGLTTVPWSNAPVPTPDGADESGPFGNPSRFSTLDGSTHQGETLQGDITSPPRPTIDKR